MFWRFMTGSSLEAQVLERGRVGEAGDAAVARLGHPRSHAPDERLLEERDVDHLVADDLLDVVDLRLPLLDVELARLLDVEIVDLGDRPAGVDAALDDVGLEPRGRIAERGGDDLD